MSVIRLDSYRSEAALRGERTPRDEYESVFDDEQAYDAKHLSSVISMFEVSEDATRKMRQKAERDFDYYDGKQLTQKEYSELVKRGQVPHVDNRIKRKIRYLEGLEQMQRTDPRALPRTPQHEEDANSVTDCLRFVTEENNFNQIRSRVWKDLMIWGWGGYEIVAEENKGKPNHRIILRRCQSDRMFWDPFSEAEDFDDARYRGLAVWGDRDEFVHRYGKKAGKVFDETVSVGQIGGTYDDKPRETTWVAYDKRYRCRIIQLYYRTSSGIWHFCEFTKGGFLTGGVSPWIGEDGKPEHPFSWGSCNVDRDNNRYGEVRDMIDPQDAINKRQSKFLHLMSVRQTFGNEMAMGSMSERQLREQAARPDGHFRLGSNVEFGKHFGVVPTTDMAQGQFQLLQQAIMEMDLQGPNAAMQGKDPRNQSGRAILAQQQGGALEANPTFDTLRHMDNDCYKKTWRRIRQFWQGEDYIRVTDDERNVRWVGINTPKLVHVLGPDGNPIVDPNTNRPMTQPQMDPRTGQPVMQNQLSQLDVDIIMDEAPSVGSMQQEEFMALVELAKAGIPISPKTILKASNIRSKHEIMKDMDQQMQAQQQQPQPELIKAQASMLSAQASMTKAQQPSGGGENPMVEMAKAERELELKARESQIKTDAIVAQTNAKIEGQQRLTEAKIQQQSMEHMQEMQLERERGEHQMALDTQQAHVAQAGAQMKHQTDSQIAQQKADQAARIGQQEAAQKRAQSAADHRASLKQKTALSNARPNPRSGSKPRSK